MEVLTSTPGCTDGPRVTPSRSPLAGSFNFSPLAASILAASPFCAIVPVPITVESCIAGFSLSLDAFYFRSMHLEGGKLVFIDAGFGSSHDTALRA